jgi:hypothetical protein
MRIFSIHKSKSKKQVSEKTPKLAAQKFLEKRKVGTVIYLQEHPSGKIHGPYRKEYDKKIMKGGLDFNHFKIGNNIELLQGSEQLIIKRTRVGLSWEPRIFFGDNTKIDSNGNYYYTYVCKNKDYDLGNLMLFRKLEFSNGMPTRITDLTHEEVKNIPPKILLGFYTQYIDRCKENFQYRGIIDVFLEDIYMRRLFYYLYLNILPVIGEYILNEYVVVENFNSKNLQHNIDFIYFMNIIKFLKRVHIREFVKELARRCNINEDGAQYKKILSNLMLKKDQFKNLPLQQEVNNIRRSISEQNRRSIGSNGNIAHGIAMSGTNPLEVIGSVILFPLRIILLFMKFAG